MNASWKGIGCSLHRVPSLSKTAIRSSGLTNWGSPVVLTSRTKFIKLCFVGLSFQEGSGVSPRARSSNANVVGLTDVVMIVRPLARRKNPQPDALSMGCQVDASELSIVTGRKVWGRLLLSRKVNRRK